MTKKTIETYYRNKYWYRFVLTFSLFFVFSSLFFNSPGEILSGYLKIITSRSLLLTDYMELTNVGSAFFNVGITSLFGYTILKSSDTDIGGLHIFALLTMAGFSFMGKNLYNCIAPVIGVYIYTVYIREDYKNHTALALFSTGIAPIVSYISFFSNLPVYAGMIMGTIMGIIFGFLLPPISANVKCIHKGYNLYNNGFAIGIIAIIIYSILFKFNVIIVAESFIYKEFNLKIIILIYLLFIFFILPKFIFEKNKLDEFNSLFKESGVSPSDFLEDYSMYTVLANMGFIGILGLTTILIVGGNVNGATIGPLICATSFGVFGAHPKNYLPVMLGILLSAYLSIYDMNAESVLGAAMFCATLAPIAGDFGFIAGVIAGFTHLALVTQTGVLHGGFLLYNNGFAAGLVASVLIPLFENVRKQKHRVKNHRF